MCAEKTSEQNTMDKDSFIFNIKSFKSGFEAYLGKCPVFSLKMMEKCCKDLRPFSLMDEKQFKHIESTAYSAPTWFPDCTDSYKIEIMVRMSLLFFIFDDHTECKWGDGGRDLVKINALWQQFFECLDKLMGRDVNTVEWKPYIWAYYATVEEIFRHFNNDQKNRFVQTWTMYANGNIAEAKYFSNNNDYKSFVEVLNVRISSIGLFPTVQLVEYVSGIRLTDEEWLNENNQLMITEASKWLIMANDITSFMSEYIECGKDFSKMHNSIAIQVLVEKMDIQSAVDKVQDVMETAEKNVFHYQQKWLAQQKDKNRAEAYLKSVNQVMAGCWVCQHALERYTGNPTEEGFRYEGQIEYNTEHIVSKDGGIKHSFSEFLKYD